MNFKNPDELLEFEREILEKLPKPEFRPENGHIVTLNLRLHNLTSLPESIDRKSKIARKVGFECK